MKQSINLKLGQSLSMTPQLQQAIRLLQMSTLDLQQEIQQALDSNLMLEVDDENSSFQTLETEAMPEHKPEQNDTTVTSEGSQTDLPDELPIDSSWEDVYEDDYEATASTNASQSEGIEFETLRGATTTLINHLEWQLDLARFSKRDHEIALSIIDSINEEGYLTASLEDVFQGLQAQMDELDFDEVKAVLHQIQNFDPSGVAAVNLQDCLRIQLMQLSDKTPYRDEALQIITQHLNLLASHDKNALIKELTINAEQLDKTVALIRSLDPKPGLKIVEPESEYVIPDVYVSKRNNIWQVNLNPDIAPKLRINQEYSSLIKRADESKVNQCLKEHYQEAKWFIKSLQGRNDTLLRVARAIVKKQTAFLEHGAIAMKPMVLKEIADELELHESTISRVTNQKYMHTPNGIVEFKYFFSSHVSTEEGGECSSTAIRALIKELVGNENPAKPLSDSKIADLLNEKGINVARRTIAKYREAMFIASSSERKRTL
ncbi:MAG: RNA polymerase factor sigma-54 [Gammaproteobacteria bacterium]|nr:RNA polymerase factor sigma-54 [Gammaproteobacteria bacterium]